MRNLGIGYQDFKKLRKNNNFYVDKTHFIQNWWESGDEVTLITRPRRFGKTLMMNTIEAFFSTKYANKSDLFEGLTIWKNKTFQNLQGTYPVLFISFAGVKENTYLQARKKICRTIKALYNQFDFLLEGTVLNKSEKEDFEHISVDMEDNEASYSLKALSNYLSRYYHKKVIILLDEYDTPMQEAYINGYWDELIGFIRGIFNETFKTNPYLERAIMTGTTRISKESIFSDLNNLEVVTTTSEKYMDCFGFTEEEVFSALDEFNLSDRKQEVKQWYDGFTFGSRTEIYNPWSILNYLNKRQFAAYWANSSSNNLVSKLIREGNKQVKQDFEQLMQGKSVCMEIDEQIMYSQLSEKRNAIWSLLLASGYLKVIHYEYSNDDFLSEPTYELSLTNMEVKRMFGAMIKDWFSGHYEQYNDFIKALLLGDIDVMNEYMNKVTALSFSYFDTGKDSSKSEPERFYHGFVLGLMVDLSKRYLLTSNRESGFGRYDIMLEPLHPEDDGIIIEFKVFQPKKEKNLQETVATALKQIEQQKYETALLARGIPKEKIRKYGFAFQGKTVLIGDESYNRKKENV